MDLYNKNKDYLKYWNNIADMVDACIDISLNHSQSGHPGGSRSKVHILITTLLSGVMNWDIRNPGKTFADRFILIAGHTNPVVYSILAVLNEALRRKYILTKNTKYKNPLGERFTLNYEDLLLLRRRGGLSGHAEMEGKTLFFKFNTGPSGHGSAPAAGQAFAYKYTDAAKTKVFAMEGEGGLTTGVSHEARISAYGLGLDNLIYIVDWNNYGIDNRPFNQIKSGTPEDWFEPYGFHVSGTEKGDDWKSILDSYSELFNNAITNKPKVIWVKTRKGRGYLKYDNFSHGSPHKKNSDEFWNLMRIFADKYNINFKYMNSPEDTPIKNNIAMKSTLDSVFNLYESIEGLMDYVADTLINIANSIPDNAKNKKKFIKNPLDDQVIYDYKNYPSELYKKPGENVPNRLGFGNWGSWVNSFIMDKYNRPLFLACSADLAESTNISGFSKGWNNFSDFGMYNPKLNKSGTLLPQGITEFANAGLMTGISTVNFAKNPYDEFNGFLTACSTYGSFSYLKYGAYRLFSQISQDSQLKVGKTLWVAGHSGPETAEDFRTHYGIFSPGVTQLFPEGKIINLHPWEYNEVPVMLGAALATEVPIIAIHLTRPPISIPNRVDLGMPSHFESSKGAYVIKDYNKDQDRDGAIFVRGTSVISELCKILPDLNDSGLNIKIVAVLSWHLFSIQSKNYQNHVISNYDWFNSMIITNTSINNMNNWINNSMVKEYSLSPDWDNNWRSGGNLKEIIDESHLSAEWQLKSIKKFSMDKEYRLEKFKALLSYKLDSDLEI